MRLVILLLLLLSLAHEAWADVGLPRGVLPVPGAVVMGDYAPPVDRWDRGHRGIDLRAAPGEVVVASAAGTVSYAGVLAGRGVVVVDHGTVRTTYEPVDATVRVGDVVGVGVPIGRVGYGGHCSGSCMHWGLRSGDAYLDPRLLLALPIRLMSADEAVAPPPSYTPGSGRIVLPASGVITSAYGWRLHPILGTRRMHDGIDIGAACGSPIRAATGGVVIAKGWAGGYGNRLVVDHGTVPGIGHLVTAYNHAESYGVAVGEVVHLGQDIGRIGSTGLSTGCHLHFSAWVDGDLIDPERLL